MNFFSFCTTSQSDSQNAGRNTDSTEYKKLDEKFKTEKRKHRQLREQIDKLTNQLNSLEVNLMTKDSQYNGTLDNGNESKTKQRLQRELDEATAEFESTEEKLENLSELLNTVNPLLNQEINDYSKMRSQFNNALLQYAEQLTHHGNSVQYSNKVLSIAIDQAQKSENIVGYHDSDAMAKLMKQIDSLHNSLFKNNNNNNNDNELKQQLKTIENSVASLKNQLNDLELSNKQKTQLIRDLEDQKHALSNSLHKSVSVSNDRKGLLNSNTQINGMNSEINQLREEIDKLSKIVRTISNKLESALYDKKQLSDMLDDAKARESRVQTKLDEQLKLSNLQNSDTDEATKYLSKQKEEAQNKVHELEDEIGRLKNNIQVLESKNQDLEEHSSGQSTLAAQLQVKYSTLSNANSDTQGQLNELQDQISKLKTENDDLKQKLEQTTKEKAALEEQCQQDVIKLRESDDIINKNGADFDHLQSKYDTQLRENERLTQLVSQLQTQKEEFTENTDFTVEIEQMKQENEQMKQGEQKLKSLVTKLQDEKDKAQQEKQEIEELLKRAEEASQNSFKQDETENPIVEHAEEEPIYIDTDVDNDNEDEKEKEKEKPIETKPLETQPEEQIQRERQETDPTPEAEEAEVPDEPVETPPPPDDQFSPPPPEDEQLPPPPNDSPVTITTTTTTTKPKTPEIVEKKQNEEQWPSFNMFAHMMSQNADRGVLGLDDSTFDKDKIRSTLLKGMEVKKTSDKIIEIAKALDGMNGKQRVAVSTGWSYSSNLPKSDLLSRMLVSLEISEVQSLNNALKKSNVETLVDIICSKTNEELERLSNVYKRENALDLAGQISTDKSIDGNLKVILYKLLKGNRKEEDPRTIKQNAIEINKVSQAVRSFIVQKKGSDICQVLAVSSWPRIVRICESVSRDHLNFGGLTVEGAVGEILGEKHPATYAIKTLIDVSYSRQYFFSNGLRASMEGAGTRQDVLYRILLSRSEIDLRSSLVEFNNDIEHNNGKTILEWFKGENVITKDLPLIAVLCGLQHFYLKTTLPFYQRILSESKLNHKSNISVGRKSVFQRWDQTIDEKIVSLKFRKIIDTSTTNDVRQLLEILHEGVNKASKDQKSEFKVLISKILPPRTLKQRKELLLAYENEYNLKGFVENNRRGSRSISFSKGQTAQDNRSLMTKHLETLLNDTTGRKLLLGLCMSGDEYSTQEICDALTNKDFDWFHTVLCLLPKTHFESIRKLFPNYSKKGIGFSDLVKANCSDKHSGMILDIIRRERIGNKEEIDYTQIVDDVKLLRYILLLKEMDTPENQLELSRAKQVHSEYENTVCHAYMLEKPKKNNKLDKTIIGHLLTHRSYDHIKKVNNAFNYLSMSNTLHESLNKNFKSSSAISLMQTILQVSIDEKDFVCRQFIQLLKKKKFTELGYLFIHRSEIDFDLIRSSFEYKNYGNGFSLKGWIHKNLHANHTSLTEILKGICDGFQIEEVIKEEPKNDDIKQYEPPIQQQVIKEEQTQSIPTWPAKSSNQRKSVVDTLLDIEPPQSTEQSDVESADEDSTKKSSTLNEEIEGLKGLFENDMQMFIKFHKFIRTFSGNDAENVKKRKKLLSMSKFFSGVPIFMVFQDPM